MNSEIYSIFQVIKKDHVAAGLCCIQLFMNSSLQEEAIKHLENAKVCFYLLPLELNYYLGSRSKFAFGCIMVWEFQPYHLGIRSKFAVDWASVG